MDTNNLIKLSLYMDCNFEPKVDIIYYNDEIPQEGYAYRNLDGQGIRSKNTIIKYNDMWNVYNFGRETYFNYYVIIEAKNMDYSKIAEKLKELYDYAIKTTEIIKKQFLANINALSTPSQEELQKIVENKFSTENNVIYILSKKDFINKIMDKCAELSDELIQKNDINKKHWDIFYNATVNQYIVETLLEDFKKLLKFKGENIEFQSKEICNKNIENIAGAMSMSLLNKFKNDY